MNLRTHKLRILQLFHARFHGPFRWLCAEDQSWLNMAPVGLEFGSPDYDRLEREDQTAFICRGKAAIARSMAAGHWIPADEVLAKLEAKVETARLRRFQN